MSLRTVTGFLTVFACAASLAIAGPPAVAQAPDDVEKSHWAYEAVQDLASKGLIKGYPPQGKFFGSRTVTRYEMATVIQRVLARVDELLTKKADKGEAPPPQPPRVESVLDTKALDEVRRLVEEFRVELTVIKTNMQKIETELGMVKSDVSGLKDKVAKHDEDIAGVKQGVSGVISSIEEQAGRIDKLNASKVEAGFGKVKVNGLFQVWGVAETDAPNKGQIDTYRLRRGEIKLSVNINPRTYAWAMFDLAKTLSFNTTSAGGNITSVSPNQASQLTQEIVFGANLSKEVAFEIGQQKVPLSGEGLRNSGQLLTVERSIMNTSSVGNNSGRTGDIREIGAMLRLTHPKIDAQLGVFQDGGARQNTTDDNNEKELMWHFQYKGARYSTLGAYQEISGGVQGPLKTQRQRLGAEAFFARGPHRLELEYVQGRDLSPAVRFQGGYALYAYRLSPMWEVVGRGEEWNPNRALHGAAYTHEYDFTLGANYYITGHNAKIQLNWIRKNINGPLNGAGTGPAALSSLGLDRNLFLVNFQQQF